ncbi:MAG: hypothetical protein U1F56_04485 [Rubrivivax sp.]
MAAPALTRRAALWAGGAAALALAVMAGLGDDRAQQLVAHEPQGPLRDWPADARPTIELRRGPAQRQVVRGAQGWTAQPPLAATDLDTRAEMLMRLLRNTPAERGFDAATPEFGLDASALAVRVQAAGQPTFEIAFGAVNPIGLARYVRWRMGDAAPAVALMPGYVAEAAERLLAP